MSSQSGTYRNRLLALIAFVIGVAALKASYSVTMPIIVAVGTIGAVWPVRQWLGRHMPGWLAYTLTILLVVLVVLSFAAAIYFSTGQIIGVLSSQWGQLTAAWADVSRWAAKYGIKLSGVTDQSRAVGLVQMVASSVYSLVTYLGFILVLIMLGLPEGPRIWRRMREELDARSRSHVYDMLVKSAAQVRGYLSATLFCSVLTGVGSALVPLATGLDLALVWGVSNFLLNFVPVIGNIVGIIPPTLYAFVQFGGWQMPLLVFLLYAVLQIVISNFIYPYVQGRQLSISPVMILVALAAWSWLWGMAGALIAVPATAALVILCRQSEHSRWIARLLARDEDEPS